MKLIYKLAFCLTFCLYVTWQTKASPFPQEDATTTELTTEGEEEEEEEEEEEGGEDVDDVYNEEGKSTSSNSTAVEEEEEEEPDPDDIEDALARQQLAKRLGIKNFSSAAIADKASKFVITHLVSRAARQPTTRPRKTNVKKTSTPIVVTTKKYSIRKTTEIPLELTTALLEVETEEKPGIGNANNTNPIRKFVITIPNGNNGTGGGTIEINIPMEMMAMNAKQNNNNNYNQFAETSDDEDEDLQASQMSISASNALSVKNIEAAIMEALLIAQEMTKMNMSSSTSNNTETLELDIDEIQNQPVEEEQTTVSSLINGVETATTLLSASPQSQQEVGELLEGTTSANELERRPTRRKRPRSTSTTQGSIPGDSLAVGPVTDLVVSGIRSGQLPSFLWTSIMKLSSSKYAQIAVDAVECAVFYYCPNDEELGTLTKGAKFR